VLRKRIRTRCEHLTRNQIFAQVIQLTAFANALGTQSVLKLKTAINRYDFNDFMGVYSFGF